MWTRIGSAGATRTATSALNTMAVVSASAPPGQPVSWPNPKLGHSLTRMNVMACSGTDSLAATIPSTASAWP